MVVCKDLFIKGHVNCDIFRPRSGGVRRIKAEMYTLCLRHSHLLFDPLETAVILLTDSPSCVPDT